jgi:glycosyltransferase involved in cell wall biosynthesis
MKILLISQDFYPLKGGIATYLMQIYENYFADDIFKAIIPRKISKRSKLINRNINIKTLEFFPFVIPSRRKEKNKSFLDILKKFNPDIVLFGYIRSHTEVMDEYRKINPSVKWGVVLHAKEVFFDKVITKKTNFKEAHKGYTKEETKEYKRLLNSADFLVCVSSFTKKLIEKQKIKNKNTFVVYPSLKYISQKYSSQEKRNFILLSVGRLVKRKGHELVLRSLKELKNSIPKIKYKIVGSGPEEKKLKSLVKKYNLQKYVEFKDDVSEDKLRNFYFECDIFVLPTSFIEPNDIEGFGIVFIEASSFAKPVIGGKTGGVIESIEDGKSGFLINPHSQEELINKINFLYKNKEKSKKMGEYGRKRIMKKFYKNKNKKFVEFLDNLKTKR